MPEILAIKSDLERFDGWIKAFEGYNVEIIDWREITDKSLVDYALVWKPAPGALAEFPNLKIIFSVGAGIDHLKGENVLPRGIPVVRMVEASLTAGMVEYVIYTTLRFHRFMPQYEQDKQDRHWEELVQIPAGDRTVGILGLGVLGTSCARALANLGFNIVGWSRTQKNIVGIECVCGSSSFDYVLGRSDILICLLPLTNETRHIINRKNLAKLPKGAYIINAGRGGQQVEVDILAALDSGQLAGAALDVFETEPLPQDSPIWDHPKIYFTPHIASMPVPATSALHVYENIARYRNGEPLSHVADMDKGY